MAYPNQAGTPSYSGTFIPEIWSSKLQVKFYDATVLAAISNTDYEGEIRNQGDKVKIRTIPSIVINDYSSGQALVNQRPESPNVELLIDKGKYWSTIVDDVQDTQADINLMNTWSGDASEQLKIAIDSDVLGGIAPDVAAANKGNSAGRLSGNIALGTTGAAVGLTKTNIIDYIVDLGTVLDEQNIPETDRYLVIPAWAAGLLKKSDLKDASLTGDNTSVMRNGRLGMIDRFTLYSSNLLPSVVDTGEKCVTMFAGHKAGLTFASQIVKTETLRAESTFGDIMRGLNVYGFEVIKPEAIAALYAYKD
jgi:hypothetical protein